MTTTQPQQESSQVTTRLPVDRPPVLDLNPAVSMATPSQVPMARVKRIIKEDPEVDKVASDAVLAISAATEIFLEYFVQHAYQYTKRDKRRTVQYKDLANTVLEVDQFQFLEDLIPPMVPLSKAIKQRQQAMDAAEATSAALAAASVISASQAQHKPKEKVSRAKAAAAQQNDHSSQDEEEEDEVEEEQVVDPDMEVDGTAAATDAAASNVDNAETSTAPVS